MNTHIGNPYADAWLPLKIHYSLNGVAYQSLLYGIRLVRKSVVAL